MTGTYKVTANSLCVRNGAGTKANDFGEDKTVLTTVSKDMEVLCLGAYTTVSDRKWLYVHFVRNGTTFTGFASSKYLEKV